MSALQKVNDISQNFSKRKYEIYVGFIYSVFFFPVTFFRVPVTILGKMPVTSEKCPWRIWEKMPVTFPDFKNSKIPHYDDFFVLCPWQKMPVTPKKCPWQFSEKCPWHRKNARDKSQKSNVTGIKKCHGEKKNTGLNIWWSWGSWFFFQFFSVKLRIFTVQIRTIF